MHLPNGFIDPHMAGGLLGLAAGVLGYCLGRVMNAVTALAGKRALAAVGNTLGNMQMGSRRALTKIGKEKIYRMAVVAAGVLTVQIIDFPVSGGLSGHLFGGLFASILLGPYAGTVVMAAVLAAQAFFFADGGVTALGANIVNMALAGSFASYYIYTSLKNILPETFAIAAAAWISVMLTAFACSLEIGLSGTAPLLATTAGMLKLHALIGVVEAAATVLLLKSFASLK